MRWVQRADWGKVREVVEGRVRGWGEGERRA